MHHWATKFSEGEVRVGDLVGGLDPHGFFYLCNAPAGDPLTIHVRFPLKMMWGFPDGVAPTSKRVVPVAGGTEFRVFKLKWSNVVPLNAADVAAGSVAQDGDTKIAFGPGAFVRLDGSVYEGEAFVQITTFDASNPDDLESFPGDFLGVDNEEGDGSETQIVSFGFVDVNLLDADFQPLALADDNPALMEFSVQNLQGDEETIPMWYYDVVSGLWVREGEGTVDQGTGMISAWVKHFTTWNADKPVTDTDCVQGVVTDGNGQPIPGAFIQGIGQGAGISNAQGEFCVNFYPGATFALGGFAYFDGSYFESVEPKAMHTGTGPGGQTCGSPAACGTLAGPVLLRRMDLGSYCLNVFLQDADGQPYSTDKDIIVNDVSMDWQVIFMGAVNGSSLCIPVPAGHQVDVMMEEGQGEWLPGSEHCYCQAVLFNEVDISDTWDPLQISEGSASCGDPSCDTLVLECECFSGGDR
jgi:hypothetical protein